MTTTPDDRGPKAPANAKRDVAPRSGQPHEQGGPNAEAGEVPEAGQAAPDSAPGTLAPVAPRDEAAVEVLGPATAVEAELVEDDELDAEDAEPTADPETLAALEDVGPISDEDLDAIAREVLARRPSAASGSTALAVRDPLAAYMAEVRRHPLLTRDEEHALAVRWVEEGDRAAGRKLVESNLRLVVKLANEYRRGYQNLLDLVQEGNIGLVKAVDKFDPYRGVKLSTYAGWWIRAYILKYILANWRLVKLGTTQNQRKLFFNLQKQVQALKQAGVDPTPERIAAALDVSEDEVVEMQKRLSASDASLDAPLRSEETDGPSRVEALADDAGEDPEESLGNEQFRGLLDEKLRRFGATLAGREREIFVERLVAEEPITLQELGERWGVSRERARQVEKRMVLRLREYLQRELGDAVEIALGHDA